MDFHIRNSNLQEIEVRRKPHSRSPKIQQTEATAMNFRIPATASSIPTKYQTVFIPTSEKNGFNSRSLRFSYSLTQNENPGPGAYNVARTSADINSVSLSKKGTGGFPSKAPRTLQCKIARTPAPNAYNVYEEFFSKKDFSKGNSSMFQQPIAMEVEDTNHLTPAPNQYSASLTYCHPNNNVSAHAAFVSKTKRELLKPNPMKGPSPCHYKINDSLVKETTKVPVSCFKSKTSRNSLNVISDNPGPASYDPYKSSESEKKIIFLRKHYLCFSAPAMPIPKAPPVPGPGHYDIVDYEGLPKQYMSGAAFVSNTSRWAGDVSGKSLPGPVLLHEMIHVHQFLSNSHDKSHGSLFHSHKRRINKMTGANIMAYPDYKEQYELLKRLWWMCNGPCRELERRIMNCQPSTKAHKRKCGGEFIIILKY